MYRYQHFFHTVWSSKYCYTHYTSLSRRPFSVYTPLLIHQPRTSCRCDDNNNNKPSFVSNSGCDVIKNIDVLPCTGRNSSLYKGDDLTFQGIQGSPKKNKHQSSSNSNSSTTCRFSFLLWWEMNGEGLLMQHLHSLGILSRMNNNRLDIPLPLHLSADTPDSCFDVSHDSTLSVEMKRSTWISLCFRAKQEVLGPLRFALPSPPPPSLVDGETTERGGDKKDQGSGMGRSNCEEQRKNYFQWLRVVPDDEVRSNPIRKCLSDSLSHQTRAKVTPDVCDDHHLSFSGGVSSILASSPSLSFLPSDTSPEIDSTSSSLFSRHQLASLLTLYHHVECDDGVLLVQLLHQLRVLLLDEQKMHSLASLTRTSQCASSNNHRDSTATTKSIHLVKKNLVTTSVVNSDSDEKGGRTTIVRRYGEDGSIAQLLFLLSSLKVAPEDVLRLCLSVSRTTEENTHSPHTALKEEHLKAMSSLSVEDRFVGTDMGGEKDSKISDGFTSLTSVPVQRNNYAGSGEGLLYTEISQYSFSSILLLGVGLHRFGFHEHISFKRTIHRFQRLLWNRDSSIATFYRFMRRLRKRYDRTVVKHNRRGMQSSEKRFLSSHVCSQGSWSANDGQDIAVDLLSSIQCFENSLRIGAHDGYVEIDITHLPLEFSLFPILLEWLDALALTPFRRVNCVECISDLLAVGALVFVWEQEQSRVPAQNNAKKSHASGESTIASPSPSPSYEPLWPLLARNTAWWLDGDHGGESRTIPPRVPRGSLSDERGGKEVAHLLSRVLWTAVQRTEQMGLPQPFLAAALQKALGISDKGILWEKDEYGDETYEDVSRLAMYDHVTADLIKVNRAN